jgi:hypothetical protein
MCRWYQVEFHTKAGGHKDWAIDLEAENVTLAQLEARRRWQANTVYSQLRQYNVKAHLLREDEPEYMDFVVLRVPKSRAELFQMILEKEAIDD